MEVSLPLDNGWGGYGKYLGIMGWHLLASLHLSIATEFQHSRGWLVAGVKNLQE